jgi:hypothetical protein
MVSDRSRLHVATFSLRHDADELSLDQIVVLVSAALGCTLTASDDERFGTDVFEAETLGIKITVGEWSGVGRKRTFQLHGETRDPLPKGSELVAVPIDNLLMELLVRRGAGHWRIPSNVELEAESHYEAERGD